MMRRLSIRLSRRQAKETPSSNIQEQSKQPSNEMEGVGTSTSSFASIMFRRNRSRNTRSSPQNDEKVDLMEIESAAAPNVGADSVVLDITRKKGRTMSPTCMEMSTSNTQELESHKLGVNSRFEDFSNGGGTNGGINSFNSSISSNNSSKNNNNNNNNENDDKSSGGDSSKNRSSNGSGRILSVCAELDVAGEVSDDTVLESGAGRAADASAATLEVAKTAMAAGGHAEPLVVAGRDAESAEARESRLRPLAERTVPTRKVMCRQVCDVCESDDDVRYAPHSPLLYDPLVGILACKFCRDHFCVELSRASREADPFLPGSLLKVLPEELTIMRSNGVKERWLVNRERDGFMARAEGDVRIRMHSVDEEWVKCLSIVTLCELNSPVGDNPGLDHGSVGAKEMGDMMASSTLPLPSLPPLTSLAEEGKEVAQPMPLVPDTLRCAGGETSGSSAASLQCGGAPYRCITLDRVLHLDSLVRFTVKDLSPGVRNEWAVPLGKACRYAFLQAVGRLQKDRRHDSQTQQLCAEDDANNVAATEAVIGVGSMIEHAEAMKVPRLHGLSLLLFETPHECIVRISEYF